MGRNVKVILQPVKFRKRSHVAILCPDNSEVDDVIREMDDVEWSTGYRFWHLPLNDSAINEITNSLKGVATVDSSAFRNIKFEKTTIDKPKKRLVKSKKPSLQQLIQLEKFKSEYLKLGYSEGTVKVYVSLLKVFFGYFNTKNENEITQHDINDFLTEYIDKNNLTVNYKRLMTNSLRRYFDFIGKNELSKI